jgi:hypothetical protein
MAYTRCVCPVWASLPYSNIRIYLEGVSPLCAGVTLRQKLRGVRLEALVSRKGGNREVTSEESETTKLGTDPSTRLRLNQAETVYRGIFTWVSKHSSAGPAEVSLQRPKNTKRVST